VRQKDHERAARIRFLYHVDWDDPLLYHIVLNTEQVSVARGVQILRAALDDPRFSATPESQRKLTEQSVLSQAKTALLVNPVTRSFQLVATVDRGVLMISGIVERDDQRLAAAEAVRKIPGVTGVLNEIAVHPRVPLLGV
jgi:hypothetical protein